MDRRFLRPGWIAGHLLVVLAVLVCLRLGWWQWGRTHDADGTGQNLGYALLWPAFGAAFIYMWVRFLQLEVIKDAEDQVPDLEKIPQAEADALDWQQDPAPSSSVDPVDDTVGAWADTETANGRTEVPDSEGRDEGEAISVPHRSRQRPSQGITISVATVGEDDDDPELTAYNQALAALAEEDRRRAR